MSSPLNYGRGFSQDFRGKRPIDYTAMDWAASINPDIAYERSYHRGRHYFNPIRNNEPMSLNQFWQIIHYYTSQMESFFCRNA